MPVTSFSSFDISRLATQVKNSEGFKLSAYRCTSGALTIGYGHNCDASPVPGVCRPGDSISKETADKLFEADLSNAVWDTRKALPWVLELDAPRQAVIYDMAFNMGIGNANRGLLSFRNTLAFIKAGRYADASRNMLTSKWARQVGDRAMRLSHQMQTGEWQ